LRTAGTLRHLLPDMRKNKTATSKPTVDGVQAKATPTIQPSASKKQESTPKQANEYDYKPDISAFKK